MKKELLDKLVSVLTSQELADVIKNLTHGAIMNIQTEIDKNPLKYPLMLRNIIFVRLDELNKEWEL